MINKIIISIIDKHNHLPNVCMTYAQHFLFSSSLALQLFIGSLKAWVHALIPCLYTTSTTLLLPSLQEQMKNAGCRH
jgi:hypothetical protein